MCKNPSDQTVLSSDGSNQTCFCQRSRMFCFSELPDEVMQKIAPFLKERKIQIRKFFWIVTINKTFFKVFNINILFLIYKSFIRQHQNCLKTFIIVLCVPSIKVANISITNFLLFLQELRNRYNTHTWESLPKTFSNTMKTLTEIMRTHFRNKSFALNLMP